MQSVHLILTVRRFTSLILPRKLLVSQNNCKIISFIICPTLLIVTIIDFRGQIFFRNKKYAS